MGNRKNIRDFGVLAAFALIAPLAAPASEGDGCLTELQGSAFAKVLRFDGGVIHVDQKAPRFVKARVIGSQKYLVEYRSADKPSAPVFTGVLTLTREGKLAGFVVENPKGETVRKCPAKETAPETKTEVPPSPIPSPKPEAPVQAPAIPSPTAEPAERENVPVAPPAEPVRIEIDTAD